MLIKNDGKRNFKKNCLLKNYASQISFIATFFMHMADKREICQWALHVTFYIVIHDDKQPMILYADLLVKCPSGDRK